MNQLHSIIVATVDGRDVSLASLARRLKQDEILDLVDAAARQTLIEAAIGEHGIEVSDGALQGMAFNADGELYLTDTDGERIWRLAPVPAE